MPRLILSVIAIFLTQSIIAQTNKIEMLELLKAFTPDSISSGNYNTWTSSTKNTTWVKWKTANPTLQNQDYVKQGMASIVVKGKNLNCQSMNGDAGPCKWAITLSGNKTKYNMVTFSADNLQLNNQADMLEYFFDSNKPKAKLLDKNIESVMYWSYKYLLQIPGKIPVWMEVQYMNQTGTAAQAENSNYTDLFYINFYFDQATFKAKAN